MNNYIFFTLIFLFLIYILISLFNNINYRLLNFKYNKIEYNINLIKKLLNSTNKYNINLYYINLDKSIDRKNRFLKKLKNLPNSYSIHPIRIQAVSPDTLPIIKKSGLFTILNNKKILSCTSSHLKAIHTAFHNNDDYAIIAEDDAIILKNIDWHLLIQLAPKDWNILQLHMCCLIQSNSNYNPIYKYHDTEVLFFKNNNKIIPSAAFYIISRDGMQKILERYIPNYKENDWNKIKELDFTYTKYGYAADDLIFYNTNRYVCTKMLIDVDGIDSTLHPSHLKLHNMTKKYINKNLLNN